MVAVLQELGVPLDDGLPIEFMGPPIWRVMGTQYVVLTHAGIKPEGEPYPGPSHKTAASATGALADQLAAYVKGAEQIAWRCLPSAEQDQNSKLWVARARLARFPQETADE